ncbi:hypothetical protein PoB_005465400 [Plakobranchus ocellatus]|uniref:Uncharacterized protein n=1 Tax=Plakobranchus ocellatus TaxID=259542 RepID=A0AAV4CAQ5_9GAST|nr:hypothetical protein PoB_005465400 [Plakobranchus ocellatus]
MPILYSSLKISVFSSLFGSTLMTKRTTDLSPHRFEVEFALDYSTLMPRFFKYIVSLQDKEFVTFKSCRPESSHCDALPRSLSPPLSM